MAQLVGASEYIDCISTERQDFPNECPGFDTKQSDSEAPVRLELLRIWNTCLLPSLPGPLKFGVVAPDRVLFMAQTELHCVLMLN